MTKERTSLTIDDGTGAPAPLRIYFAGSIMGGREDVAIYEALIRHARRHGTVLTEHVAERSLVEPTPRFVYERDVAWLRSADLLIAEVTRPSHGVGMELGIASELGIETLCLYRPSVRPTSWMILGHPSFRLIPYERLDEALAAIDDLCAPEGRPREGRRGRAGGGERKDRKERERGAPR